MSITVTIRDETPGVGVLQERHFIVQDEVLKVRELIHQRVHQEVSLYNLRKETPRGVIPKLSGLPGWLWQGGKAQGSVDWQEQARLAEWEFENNGFFILVDDRQVEDLDEWIRIGEGTDIRFVRLTPLVGG